MVRLVRQKKRQNASTCRFAADVASVGELQHRPCSRPLPRPLQSAPAPVPAVRPCPGPCSPPLPGPCSPPPPRSLQRPVATPAPLVSVCSRVLACRPLRHMPGILAAAYHCRIAAAAVCAAVTFIAAPLGLTAMSLVHKRPHTDGFTFGTVFRSRQLKKTSSPSRK